jgi:hypothetical protein
MITQEHIDEWTRHAPAAGLERDLIIAQRAAQLAQSRPGTDRRLRWEIACQVAGWASTARLGDNAQGVAAEILFLVAGWVRNRGLDRTAELLHAEAKRK